MDSRPIGIFDSGVGGLTVYKELEKILPNENIIYLGDTKNFPYGNKTREEIIEVSVKNTEILIQRGAKIIIIACGTATSQALETLRDKFNIPIIGIIEPTVEYIKKQKIKEIGIIATEGTIRSGEWERKIKEKISDIKIQSKACPMLAVIAEEGRAKGEEGRKTIKEYMKQFKQNKIDKIILGCTHYPIYEDIIRQELGYPVELINTGVHVAQYTRDYLNKNKIENEKIRLFTKIYLTKPEDKFKNIAQNIMNVNVEIEEI